MKYYLNSSGRTFFNAFQLNRYISSLKANAMFCHIWSNKLSNLLVKSSQENRTNLIIHLSYEMDSINYRPPMIVLMENSYHDCRVDTNASKESSAFESDVGSTNKQSFARVMGQRKDIIWCDAELSSTWNVGIAWTTTGGKQDVFRRDCSFFLLLIGCLRVKWKIAKLE